MNHCAIAFASSEEMRTSYSDKESLVCPKPRRLSFLNTTVNNDPIRTSFRWHVSYQQELCDSGAGADLLDIILTKGGTADQSAAQVDSSPPFFCGSPPSRVSNPLIQDARFGDEKFTPISPRAILSIPFGSNTSPSSSSRKNGYVRSNFGNNPAVRVEGFDCLDRDSRNCSIPALA